jgi:hypothetical protein
VLLIKYWVTEPHCILQASKITYFSYSYSKLWFNKINLSSAGPHLGGATEVANKLVGSRAQAGWVWGGDDSAQRHQHPCTSDVWVEVHRCSVCAQGQWFGRSDAGTESGPEVACALRGRDFKISLVSRIQTKRFWNPNQGYRLKDFEIQTKDKSSIFEFNSRLSKRDLNLFKDQEFDKGDLSRNQK